LLENGVNEFFAVNDIFPVAEKEKKLLKKKILGLIRPQAKSL